MARFKVVDLPASPLDEYALATRFYRFLLTFRARKKAAEKGEVFDDIGLVRDGDELGFQLDYRSKGRIDRRVDCIVKRRMQQCGLDHLKKDELQRLRPALTGLPAVLPGSEHWADEVAAALHAEMPWMGFATDYAWQQLRLCARRGTPVSLGPVLLNGPYGIGKSVWARKLADHLSLPFVDVDASKGGAGFSLAGVERGWGSAQPGRPVEVVLSRGKVNPLCVVDEVCKAKEARSKGGSWHSFSDTLLALMEPATARRWECPFFRVPFDLSHLSWVLTSNILSNVAPAVLSRCQIIDLPDVTMDDLHQFARRQGTASGLSVASIEAIQEALLRAPTLTGRRLSLRDVNRMIERAEMLENKPQLQ